MPGAKPSAPDRGDPRAATDKSTAAEESEANQKPTPAQHEQARQTLRDWLGVGEPISGTDAKGAPKTATQAAQDAESATAAASQGVKDANDAAGNHAH